jgi:hypothetical protein
MTLKKATLVFSFFLSLLTFCLSLAPGHNGDMPFYIAAVFSRQGLTDQEAFSKAREVIREEMSSEEGIRHIYRLDHADKNLLDFYRIKPLYIFLIAAFHHVGIPFILSTLIPSLISFFLIGCILFSWSAKVFAPLPALIFSIILLLINPSIILARLSSPDPLSNLFLFYCFYRIYFEKRYTWTILFLLVSLFIRLDNLIAVCILAVLMKYWPAPGAKTRIAAEVFLFTVLVAVATAVWVNFYFESGFWWFTRVTYIQSFHAYCLQVLVYFLSLSQSFFPALLLFAFLAVFKGKMKGKKRTVHLLLGIGSILFFRFLLFPSFEERFETAFYLTGFLLLLEILSEPAFSKGSPPIAGESPVPA